MIWDIEANGFWPGATQVHCVAIDNILYPPHEVGVAALRLSEANELVGHNILSYDIPVMNELLDADIDPDTTTVHDTLLLSQLLYPNLSELDHAGRWGEMPAELAGRHSLKAWGLRLNEFKTVPNEDGDWSQYTPEMGAYCLQDVAVTAKLYTHLINEMGRKGAYWGAYWLEVSVAKILNDQQSIGWTLNVHATESLLAKIEDRQTVLKMELVELVPVEIEVMKTPAYYYADLETGDVLDDTKGALVQKLRERGLKPSQYTIKPGPPKTKQIPFNPSSRQQVAEYLQGLGWKPEELTPTGRPVIDYDVLSGLDYQGCTALAEWYQLQKVHGYVVGWLEAVSEQGQIHHRCNGMGTGTHRATHSSPNLGQVPSGRALYGSECRELFIPRDGMVLVGADLSGIELRMLAHYVDDPEFTDQILNGDIHQFLADIYECDRDTGKTVTYAQLYGAGNAKIGQTIGGGIAEGKSIKARLNEALPAFSTLNAGVQAAAKKNGYVVALDGRRIPVRSPHSALNFLLQSGGSIIAKKWMVEIHAQMEPFGGWNQLGWIHDEVQLEALPDTAELLAKQCELTAPRAGQAYDMNIPIAAEAQIGSSWKDTH